MFLQGSPGNGLSIQGGPAGPLIEAVKKVMPVQSVLIPDIHYKIHEGYLSGRTPFYSKVAESLTIPYQLKGIGGVKSCFLRLIPVKGSTEEAST